MIVNGNGLGSSELSTVRYNEFGKNTPPNKVVRCALSCFGVVLFLGGMVCMFNGMFTDWSTSKSLAVAIGGGISCVSLASCLFDTSKDMKKMERQYKEAQERLNVNIKEAQV